MAQAKTGDHVKVHFTGRLEDGTIFTSSTESEPIEFTLGRNEVLPRIEDAVEGMEPGEVKTVHVPSEEAYGDWHEELTQEIPRDSLPNDLDLEIGQQLQIDQPGAPPLVVSIAEVSDVTVTIDANHPLAGRDLVFDLELVAIS